MRKKSASVTSQTSDPDDPASLAALNDQYEGYCADLAKKIADSIGFRYRIVPVRDKKYGAVEPNGTWNGMVGELIRHVRIFAIPHSDSTGTVNAHTERRN